MGARPGGISSITERSRSAYAVSASVRGIGVAVMTSMCGSPASRAARWRTPKRCCSSITTTARCLNCHLGLDERVRTDHDLDAAVAQSRVHPLLVGRLERTDQQRHAHAEALHVWHQGAEVLHGQNLGGHHHDTPGSPASAAASRVAPATSVLPRTDVALQQAVHAAIAVARSAWISSSTRRCARVSGNGSASRKRCSSVELYAEAGRTGAPDAPAPPQRERRAACRTALRASCARARASNSCFVAGKVHRRAARHARRRSPRREASTGSVSGTDVRNTPRAPGRRAPRR